MNRIIIIILVLIFQNSVLFSQEEWNLNRDSDGIKVYTKKEEGYNFKTFKAIAIVNGTIHQFIEALADVENLPNWAYNVKSAELLEKTGDTLLIYYSIAKAPFPYKDRDGIYLNRYQWDSKTKTLEVAIKILDDYLEETDKYIRVKGAGYWKIKVLPSNKMEVTFSMQVDPGGNVPSWLANMFVDGTPYHTMLNLKEIIESNSYKKEYDFID